MLKLPAKRFCSFPSSQQLDLKSSSERPLACWGGSTANKLRVQGCGSYCTGMWGVEKREFKETRKVSKVFQLKMSHSASSLCILTLDMQLQLSISGGQILFFLCFFLPKQETCNKDGRHLRDFVQLGGLGWGIGRLCGGLELEVGGTPKPRPPHQAPAEVPQRSSANSSPHRPICHQQQACLWRIQGKRLFALPALLKCGNVHSRAGAKVHRSNAHLRMHFAENTTCQLLHTDIKPAAHLQLTLKQVSQHCLLVKWISLWVRHKKWCTQKGRETFIVNFPCF